MNLGETGKGGEDRAALYLRMHGYRVVCRNYRTRFGELDVVAENGQFLVFAEVKTRSPGALVGGAEAVGAAKQQKLRAAALQYLQEHPTEKQPRFDVLVVERSGGAYHVTQHYESAF